MWLTYGAKDMVMGFRTRISIFWRLIHGLMSYSLDWERFFGRFKMMINGNEKTAQKIQYPNMLHFITIYSQSGK